MHPHITHLNDTDLVVFVHRQREEAVSVIDLDKKFVLYPRCIIMGS